MGTWGPGTGAAKDQVLGQEIGWSVSVLGVTGSLGKEGFRAVVLSLPNACNPLIQFLDCGDPDYKIMSLLLHHCGFVIIRNHNITICAFQWF